MRRTAVRLTALACALAATIVPVAGSAAQGQTRRPAPVATRAVPGQPAHAWLFGTWTGGIFPAQASGINAEVCLSQPVVIFTRDVVMRATLTDQYYTQRLIETALTTPNGTQFRFIAAPAAGSLMTGGSPGATGFGCDDPNTLVVERKSANVIVFQGCGDFPNPLVRCPSR